VPASNAPAAPALAARTQEIVALTVLRGVAAWVVVSFHFARDVVPFPAVGRLLGSGHVAVDLFFVLSGFVLAHRYEPTEVARGGRRAFWVRRFARIYPVYLMSLAIGFAAEWPRSLLDLGHTTGEVRLGLQLLLLNAWSHKAMFRLNWAAWSLSAEALMYLVFPWLLGPIARLSTRGLVLLLLACWACTFLAPAVYTALDPDGLGRPLALGDEALWSWYLKFFPLPRLPEFIAGIAAASLLPRTRVHRGAVTLLVTAALVAICLSRVVPYAYLQAGTLLPLFVALVLVLGASSSSSAATRRLTAPLAPVGRASYATYILHVPVFLLVAHFHPAIWDHGRPVAIYMASLLALSLAVHRWFEEPARAAIVRRWGRDPRPPHR
jgi:peptidoglycan/LPS O-acetylase OafA/YrhL